MIILVTQSNPGIESMGKPWKKHGENSMDSLENHGAWSQSKIPWFSWDKLYAFHAIAWDRKIVTVFPMKAWKAWNIRPWKTMESIESMGIYKNESMESMESMGKHGIFQYITFNNI